MQIVLEIQINVYFKTETIRKWRCFCVCTSSLLFFPFSAN